MEILKLTVEFLDKKNFHQNKIFSEKIEYNFGKKTLITSSNEENSKGKTSLLRFLLYALGYKIPHTDGMNIYKFKTTLILTINGKQFELLRGDDKQYINNSPHNSDLPMISTILKINSLSLSNALLGCYYIDQEKGWTLFNRGLVIGKINFNIERFLLSIKNDDSCKDLIIKSENLENEKNQIKKIEDILAGDYIYINEDDSSCEIDETSYKNFLEQRQELDSIRHNIYLKNKEKKELDMILKNNEEFIQKIEQFNIVIQHNKTDILVTRDNLKSFNLMTDILEMKRNEIILETDLLKNKEKKLFEILKNNNTFPNALNSALNNLKKNLSKIELEIIKKEKERTILKNKEEIIKHIQEPLEEFWEILKKILKDIGISEKYIQRKIILERKLAGISGAQRHKLSLAYKIALNLYVEKKFQIKLPFIIDSPLSGEVTQDMANKMLNICEHFLKNHQIIISSVKSNFDIKFTKEIRLEEGVVGELEKFQINNIRESY